MMAEYYGHVTTLDGTHVPLTKETAGALWEQCKQAKARRNEAMPETADALDQFMDAWIRLGDLGWRHGIYCPKDGTEFAVIQVGSAGIFSGFYCGEWPKGRVMVCDYSHHPDGCLWKALDQLTDAEREKFDECNETQKILHDREVEAFSQLAELTTKEPEA